MSNSSEVKRCFAKRYLNYAVARDLAAEDSCTLDHLQNEFAASGDLKQLILKVASSDAFRLRATEGPGAQQ